MRYRHDEVSGRTTLVIDVEVPEDEMPHEHRQELREMAEEVLGMPLGSLPEEVTVNLRRAGHAHPEGSDHDHGHEHEGSTEQSGRAAAKAGH
jgi:hypothetical protein